MAAKDLDTRKEDAQAVERTEGAQVERKTEKVAAPKVAPRRDGVAFRPAEGINRVELAVQGRDELIIVEGEYRTSDRVVIAALDAHPFVTRVGGES